MKVGGLITTQLNTLLKLNTYDRLRFGTHLVILLYTVGFLGILIEPEFSLLSPFNLFVSMLLVFWLEKDKSPMFFLNAFLIMSAGFVLEVVGTNTGLIFGSYTYGDALGFKANNTPLFIGLNWFLVTYGSVQTVVYVERKLKKTFNEFVFSMISAIFMTILDLCIEPKAGVLDLWTWEDSVVPLQNYTAWFFFGFAFSYWLKKTAMLQENQMAQRVLLAQTLFFGLLTLAL